MTRGQALYALERLWERAAGAPAEDWEGPPALVFPALTKAEIEANLDLRPGALPWAPLADFLPAGAEHPFDTDKLPALGWAGPQSALHYDGAGLFPLDLPAAAFLLLTRWEDVYRPVLDALGRPEETAGLNYRQNFHDRPVLDEWGRVLKFWLQKARPGRRPAEAEFNLRLTHDIDNPYYFKSSWLRIFRRLAGHIIRDRALNQALKAPGEYFRTRRDFRQDPYYQGVLSLMDFDESLGRRGTFFFMTAKPGRLDEGYDLSVPPYRDLLWEVSARGHEIGWHPGFEASRNETVFEEERQRANHFFGPEPYGARRHYLAWRGPQSWSSLAAAGCRYDAGLGYCLRIGFRCSTASSFPAYDFAANRPLNLPVRPLIVQDYGLMAETDFDFEAGLKKYRLISRRTKAVGGELTLLIHNSYERLLFWVEKLVLAAGEG